MNVASDRSANPIVSPQSFDESQLRARLSVGKFLTLHGSVKSVVGLLDAIQATLSHYQPLSVLEASLISTRSTVIYLLYPADGAVVKDFFNSNEEIVQMALDFFVTESGSEKFNLLKTRIGIDRESGRPNRLTFSGGELVGVAPRLKKSLSSKRLMVVAFGGFSPRNRQVELICESGEIVVAGLTGDLSNFQRIFSRKLTDKFPIDPGSRDKIDCDFLMRMIENSC